MHPPKHQRQGIDSPQPSLSPRIASARPLTRTWNPDLRQRRLADPSLSRPRLSGRGDGLHKELALLCDWHNRHRGKRDALPACGS